MEREPELDEVLAIVQALNDPGNGLDKIRIALLKMQVDGITTQQDRDMQSSKNTNKNHETKCLISI